MMELLRRIWYLLNRRRIERDMADEMAYHRELMAAGNFGSDLRRRQRRGSVFGQRDRQQFGQQRQRRRIGDLSHCQQRAEFFGAHRRRIGRRETGGAREILDYRVERAIAVIGGTLQIDARMRFACKLLLQCLDRARFPDPGFAGHGHDLTFALTRQMPA